ncbi:MAG: glycosyltransferase [Rhodobacter sp.]|nr:glycosyltransferase [Rhodobacter sp.]
MRYLLVVPIPYFVSSDGSIWLNDLWLRDLRAHLDYIDDLTVLAPCGAYVGQPELKRACIPKHARLRFSPLPVSNSFPKALLSLPKTVFRVIRAVKNSDVVHSGVAGWPIPPGLVVNPLAALMGKPLIIVVESAFWRVSDPATATRRVRLRAFVTEAFAKLSIKYARLAIFTQKAYRDELKGTSKARLMVAPATWISAENTLPRQEAEALWARQPKRPRFLLAARLIPEKGVHLALNALRALEVNGIEVEFDIIGEGPLADDVLKTARDFQNVRLRLLRPTPYGAPFFRLLQRYQVVVVPSLSDEQPRIILDAYSQSIPVIASHTAGNRQVVDSDKTGWLFPKGDLIALADCLTACIDDPSVLRPCGLNGLELARSMTHEAMHLERAEVIAELFGK